MARTQILVHSWEPRTRISALADRLNQSLVYSVIQATLASVPAKNTGTRE